MAIMIFNVTYSGQEYRAEVIQGDIVRFELEASRSSWPDISSAPALWSSYLAYQSLVRTGQVPAAVTFDQFVSGVEAIDVEQQVEVNPTPEDQSPG
jgi:hypothetical protein